MFKRAFVVTIALIVVFAFLGCGSKSNGGEGSTVAKEWPQGRAAAVLPEYETNAKIWINLDGDDECWFGINDQAESDFEGYITLLQRAGFDDNIEDYPLGGDACRIFKAFSSQYSARVEVIFNYKEDRFSVQVSFTK